MPGRWFEIRRGLIAVRRVLTLLVAGGVGWVLASQWLAAQETPPLRSSSDSRAAVDNFDRPMTGDWLTGEWPAPPPAVGPTCHSQKVADGPAGCAFWASPSVSPPPTRSAATAITKIPFRYGDFGATSHPIRHVTQGYYRSRTDWVWQ
jgi:hypothetical protein